MRLLKLLVIVIMMSAWIACSLDAPSQTRSVLNIGDADFTRYVALGNSMTAGFQSSALTEIHQNFSYPNLIATQTETETFVQPLLGYPGIGLESEAGKGIQELLALDGPVIENASYGNYPSFNPLDPYISDNIKNHPAPYNNLGVPLGFLWDILNATDANNCYTGRLGTPNTFFLIVLRNPNLGDNYTPFQQAKLLQPTFITCWAGLNDVFGFASSGGTMPPFPTPSGVFNTFYTTMMDSLSDLGAQLVVANIPDVTTFPLFTTLPGVVLDPDTDEPVLDPGGNPIPLVGVNPQTDLVLLTAIEAMENGLGIPLELGGTGQPLPDEVFLDANEISSAKSAIESYNNSIATVAAGHQVPVVDMYAFFNGLKANGYSAGGQDFSTDYIAGGLFSLDGAHPSDIGSALIANEFIKVINENFNAQIPLVNIIEIADVAAL